jgi:hypothetical protein
MPREDAILAAGMIGTLSDESLRDGITDYANQASSHGNKSLEAISQASGYMVSPIRYHTRASPNQLSGQTWTPMSARPRTALGQPGTITT